VLVAGMAVGTAFTLFFVPAIYVLVSRERRTSDEEVAVNDDESLELEPQASRAGA
jgi:hypothetical protein